MKLFHEGSLADVDARFVGIDVVTAVEVVEQLHLPGLAAVPHTIFGGYRPRIAVISDIGIISSNGLCESFKIGMTNTFKLNSKIMAIPSPFHCIGAIRSNRDKVATIKKCARMAFTLLDGHPPPEAAAIPKADIYVHKESIDIPFFN
ncbi:hypothetical protein BJ742DRAFT_373482 [Cladochytrium replicatum]|nr:hypothetical protein BJ742DRAFT_373482 [Cladochytrium replicatum]